LSGRPFLAALATAGSGIEDVPMILALTGKHRFEACFFGVFSHS
jgi:hypothetical protein